MTHRGPFQPLPFCDSVILWFCEGNLSCMPVSAPSPGSWWAAQAKEPEDERTRRGFFPVWHQGEEGAGWAADPGRLLPTAGHLHACPARGFAARRQCRNQGTQAAASLRFALPYTSASQQNTQGVCKHLLIAKLDNYTSPMNERKWLVHTYAVNSVSEAAWALVGTRSGASRLLAGSGSQPTFVPRRAAACGRLSSGSRGGRVPPGRCACRWVTEPTAGTSSGCAHTLPGANRDVRVVPRSSGAVRGRALCLGTRVTAPARPQPRPLALPDCPCLTPCKVSERDLGKRRVFLQASLSLMAVKTAREISALPWLIWGILAVSCRQLRAVMWFLSSTRFRFACSEHAP